jgi:parallel beta-helix repeat protein
MKVWCAVLAVVLLSSCGDSDSGSAPSSMTVHAGESIQAAINAAPPNSTIFVEAGVYHESPGAANAIVISKDGLRIVGQSSAGHPVVLENAGGQMNGIVVAPTDSIDIDPTEEHPGEHPACGANGKLINSFSLKGFSVRGFEQFGVYLACVDGFTLDQNFADADLLYSLFPVRSHNGTLTNNEVQNTTKDAALYVGQSDHVTITGNMAHDNLLGLEIENSSDITAKNNEVFNNTAGIIADINAGLQKKDQVNVLIADNNIHDNNLPNSADEGDSEGETPPGTGMVILGGSMVTVQNNMITNNGFAGIIVASYCTGTSACSVPIDIDPDPTNAHIVNNTLSSNGLTPPADPLEAALAADLVRGRTSPLLRCRQRRVCRDDTHSECVEL